MYIYIYIIYFILYIYKYTSVSAASLYNDVLQRQIYDHNLRTPKQREEIDL